MTNFSIKAKEIINKKIHNLEPSSKNFCIFSDSESAIKALVSPSIKSKLMLQCLGQLNELANGNNVQLVWVPGHSKIQGNEKADQLARHGAS